MCAHTSFGVNKGYMNLGEWERVFRVRANHWLEFKILGRPHLLVEALQEVELCLGLCDIFFLR